MFIPDSDWSGFVCRHYLLFLLQNRPGHERAREVQKKPRPSSTASWKPGHRGGLPTPKVYIIDDPSPNAFATPRPAARHCGCHFGILNYSKKTELEGVIAQELSHCGNYDIRFMSVVVALVSVWP